MSSATQADRGFVADFGIEEIRRYLPHRQPFLFIDRVLRVDPGPRVGEAEGACVVARKCVTYGEPFFSGHFPGRAVMPGVLVVEALAQAACFSLLPTHGGAIERVAGRFQVALVGVDAARFRRPVVPGDVLELTTRVERVRGKLWFFSGEARVGADLVAEAKFIASLEMSADAEPSGKEGGPT